MKVEYKIVDLKTEKNVQPIESFIELTEDLLHWRARYYCDIPVNFEDESMGWHNKMKSSDIWVKKSNVIGVGKGYIFGDNIWQVYIDASGLAGTMEMYFKRESEATAFSNTITEWMIK